MQLPPRVQAELQAAEALEAADQVARSQAPARVASVSDLIAPQPTPVVAAPPQPPAPAPAPVPPKDDFEHKYRVLQGMYEADVKQLKASVRALTEAATARDQAPPQETRAAVDPKDVQAFGQDMMDMVQRYVTGAVNALDGRIQAVEAQLGSVTQDTAQTKEQQFYALLDQLMPQWRAVNAQPDWLQWLGVKDEVYGLPRQAALDNAFSRLDAQQVAKIFATYVASIPVVPPQETLDNQITPDGAGSQPPAPVDAKPILSERAITAFYNDKARGAYRGREAEADSIEAQIDAAVAEGRVAR